MEGQEHTYIAIDLKSFYASVECVERGLDPLTTNLVVADESRTEKADVLRYALETMGVGAAESLMVGDREHDVLGAKALGLPCLGVLWGYGSREELTEAGAAALAETPEEMAERILAS